MTATFVVFGMKVYSEMYQKIVITKVGWLRFRLNRFWRWLLEITPSQQNGSREDYRGQGIQTIELDGNRLEVKGFYNGTSTMGGSGQPHRRPACGSSGSSVAPWGGDPSPLPSRTGLELLRITVEERGSAKVG